MPSVFSFDGKIFYFNSVRIKIDSCANRNRLTIKQADIESP